MSVKKNYIYNLAYQMTALIVPFISTPYISRIFGSDGVGSYAISYSIAQYTTILGILGLNNYGARQIAYCRDDEDSMERTFWNLNYMRFLTMTVAVLFYCIYFIQFVESDKMLLYLSQGIVISASFLDISWYFAGIEEFRTTAIRNILVKIIGLVLVFVLVKRKDQVWLYALIIGLTLFVGHASTWGIAIKRIKRRQPEFTIIKRYLYETFKLWIPTIAINVYTSLDKIMLGYLVGDSEAGIYENSQKTIRVVSAITTSLSTVMTPKMANYYKKNRMEELAGGVYRAFHFVSFLAVPMSFGIIAVRNTFVPWFYGPGFEKVSVLLIISAWFVITLSWSNVLGGQVLIACEKENKYTIAVTCGAVVNLAMNIVLIPNLQSLGAILASVVAEYIGMFLMMYFSKEVVAPRKLLSGVPKYFIVSAFMCAITYVVGELIGYNAYSTFLQLAVGMLFYFSVLYFLKDENVFELLHILKKFFVKGRR